MTEEKKMLFSQDALKKLLWPLIIEQFLAIAMGMADTVMAASCGEAVVSGISLVDSICVLLIGLFTAMASGGAVVAAQYMGHGDKEMVGRASNQLFIAVGGVALLFMTIALIWNKGLLALLYGNVEADVMNAARIYFYIVAVSFPFLGIYNGGAALFRAVGDSKVSMKVSLVANLVNIAGNAILIYGAGIGAAGAALSTLFSRILSAVMIIVLLGKSDKIIVSNHWRVDTKILGKILYIGVPNGLENSIFQIGKLLTTSLIAGFGMAATTANAVTGSIASFQQIPANAIGVAMITVIGQCIGAGETEQALYYLKKMMKVAYACMILLGIPMIIFARPICGIYHLSPETMKITVFLLCYSCVCCMLVHPLSFAQSNALRAAGDVRFTMIVAIASMWLCRVGMAYVLGQGLGLGVIGVWIAMTMDWVVRAFLFTNRIRTGKWLKYKDRLVK